MEFIDKLSAGLTNAGRTVSQSAKNFSDTNALKREINTEKRNIQQKYAEIGQLYYEKYNNDPGCEFFPEVDAILTSMRHIEALEYEIQEVQNRRPELIIPSESSSRSYDSRRPSAMVCMQCGKSFDSSYSFCANCGQKLVEQFGSGAASTAPPVVTPPVSSVTQDPPTDTKVIPNAPAAPVDLHKTEEKPAETKRYCLNCGAEAAGDSVFCAQCGNKLV